MNSRGLSEMELKHEIKWDFNSNVFMPKIGREQDLFKGKLLLLDQKLLGTVP